MGLKIGDIDIANEIIDLRFQVIRLAKILEYLHNKNPSLLLLDQNELKKIEEECIVVLKNRFPNMGIEKKEK